MAKPRGRLFQDDRFEVAELRGRVVEELIGYTNSAENDDHPEILFLKPKGGFWQRFFLDAGLGFWEEWSEADAFDDCLDLRPVEYGARYRVIGDEIGRVTVARANDFGPAAARPRAMRYRTTSKNSGPVPHFRWRLITPLIPRDFAILTRLDRIDCQDDF